jgi:Putative beta-barrel porin 2
LLVEPLPGHAQLQTAAGAVGSLQNRSAPAGTGGAKVGETAYLRLGVLAEAGLDSNVFYNDQSKIDSPTLRITPHAEISNTARDGQYPPIHYSLAAYLLYREYLSDDPEVQQQRAFNPTVTGLLAYSGSPTFSIALADAFSRLEEPPYSPGVNVIVMDSNQAVLDMRITPGGGRLQTTLRYTNGLQYFEDEQAHGFNNMSHQFLAGISWKWLPKTALFAEAHVGYIQYLDEALAQSIGKADSIPFGAIAGIRGLLTPKLTLNLGVGYIDAAYENDVVNPSGASKLAVSTSLIYRPVQLTSLTVAYDHLFRDSPVVGNFVDVDTAAAGVNQQLGPFVLRAFYLYEFRRFQGHQLMTPVTRRDHFHRAGVQADYFLQRWFFAGVGYSLALNRGDVDGPEPAVLGTSIDYTKHTVVGRLGITY